jgi:nucleoside-diphosphate-sugar epimerase
VHSTTAKRAALWGAGGFIGSAVLQAADAAGIEMVRLPKLPLDPWNPGDPVEAALKAWLGSHPTEWNEAVQLCSGAGVVINAAGLADPEESDVNKLMAANVLLPAVIAAAAAEAGVPRLVHVSTAAVQGNRDPLDETAATQPLTPYASSKAEGERLLLKDEINGEVNGAIEVPAEVVIYRPTSVQGVGRSVTRALVRIASGRVLLIPGRGDVPLPVSLVGNVGAGIVHAALMAPPCPPILLQPWEGMTTRSLLEAFGNGGRLVSIPKPAVTVVRYLAAHQPGVRSGRSPKRQAKLRRLELLAFGQAVHAQELVNRGFRPHAGPDEYRNLAGMVRAGGSFSR